MTNHVHLVVGASECTGDIGRLTKSLGGRQTWVVNTAVNEIFPLRALGG